MNVQQSQVQTTSLLKENPYIKEIEPSKSKGSSLAVVVDEVALAHTGQFLPLNKKGELIGKGDVTAQVNQIFYNISAVLKEAGSDIGSVVKINAYITQPDLMARVQEQLSLQFAETIKPAVSFVVGDLAHPDALVAMDVIATSILPAEDKAVKYFRSAALPGKSAATHVSVLPVGGVVYISGQADKGKLVEATRGTLEQLGATLEHLGLKKEHVIQIKSFMCPMSDVEIVEKEIARLFKGGTVPPVVYVDWISKSPVIEIELIVASPNASPRGAEQVEFITPSGMSASPVYSKVTKINKGKKVYVSGLYGKTSDEPQAQVSEIFASLGRILKKAGSDFSHLAKATYYVSNDTASVALNELRPKFYNPKRPPAASKAMVRGVGIAEKSITIDMIGVVVE